MKQSRRSEKLDKLLGQEVIIEFWDGSTKEGILEFNLEENSFFRGYYRVGIMNFRKSTVRRFKKKGCEKWQSCRLGKCS